MADLVNELVWSHSRAKLFATCLRAYWFNYYGSWGGWDAAAAACTRQAYVEKKLTTRAQWIGTVVHHAAELGVQLARRGRMVDVEQAVRHARERAWDDVRGSESGAWLSRPARRVGFAEHYYREPVDAAGWEAAVAEVERQVRVLYAHRIFRRIQVVPERVREVEELRRFRVGDAEVYVALDVLVDDGRGGVVIVDWKTGEAHDDATIAAQLGVYGLYVTQELGVPVDRVTAMHVNLRHATETRHPVGEAELAAARAEIAETMAAMRARLTDVGRNLARAEDHPPLPPGDPRCARCNFRRICGREWEGGQILSAT